MKLNSSLPAKEILEKQKLLLEIESLKKPAWKKISFWNFIMPTAIAIGSLALLAINGAFDFKAKELEAKKQILILQIEQFAQQRDKIVKDTMTMSLMLKSLAAQTEKLLTDKAILEKSIFLLSDSLSKKDEFVSKILKINRNLSDSIVHYKFLTADDSYMKQMLFAFASLADTLCKYDSTSEYMWMARWGLPN